MPTPAPAPTDADFAAVCTWADLARLLARCEKPPAFLKHGAYRVRGRAVRSPVSLRRYDPKTRTRLIKPFAMVMTLGGAPLRPALSAWTYDVWGVWKNVRLAARICHDETALVSHASDVVAAELTHHARAQRLGDLSIFHMM